MISAWRFRIGGMLLGASLLVSCGGGGEQTVAGKPAGSETSDELAARVIDSDGMAVAGATVRLRPATFAAGSSPSGDYLDLVSDGNGNVTFPAAPAGRWVLEARTSGKGVVMPFLAPANGGHVLPVLVVRPFGGIRGKVDLPIGSKKAYVRLVGVDRIDSTDTAGNFHIRDLSPTDSAVTLRVSRQDDETMIAETLVQVKASETIDLGQTRTPSLLLSDFEDGLKLGLPWPEARWYVDAKAWLVDGKIDTMAKGRSGKAYRASFLEGYAGVVFLNANFRGSRDLLGMDSVEIWVRGKGGVSLYLYSSAGSWPKLLDTMVVADSVSWKRFVVKAMSPFGWRELLKPQFEQATGLAIKLESSGFGEDISVDDIRLYGVSARDWR
ncbi:MAG: hypothetical protein IPK50_10045 [Fibrobacterota bacterium]|nr:hypothetical protein [Fibrobacterota bacterium]QQS07219.1 MAG: hypothetical protein IPK50_10045 [Fibrobacterota bacterium]